MSTEAEIAAAAEQKAAADAAVKAAAEAAAKEGDALYWKAEAKKAFEDRDKIKVTAKENAAAAAELKTLKESQMSEMEKVNARLKVLEPLGEEVKQHRETFTKLLTAELEGMSEEHKSLIPGLPNDAQKLTWVREAKAKGLFGMVKPSIGSKLPGNGTGATITKKEYSQLPLAKFEQAGKDIKAGKLMLTEG